MPTLQSDFDVAEDFKRLIQEESPAPLVCYNEQTGNKHSEQWIWASPEGVELSLMRIFDAATGKKHRELWFQNQIRYRQNGPSEQRYSVATGHKTEDQWLEGTEWSNPHGGPAHIKYDEKTGAKTEEIWVQDNQAHRDDGPAHIHYDAETGNKTLEIWMQKGKRHRMDGPAVICYDAKTGEKIYAQWMVNGYEHNPHGGLDVERYRLAKI